MHIETIEKERGGGSDPRKGKGQLEKECKTKRVKGGLEKQRKSQLHIGGRRASKRESTEKEKKK